MSFWQRLTWWLLLALAPVMIGHGAFVYWRERQQQIKAATDGLDAYAQLVQRAVEQTQSERGWGPALILGRALEPSRLAFAAGHRFWWVRRPEGAPDLEEAPPDLKQQVEAGTAPAVRRDHPDGRWHLYRTLRGTDGSVVLLEVSHDAHDVESFVRETALEEVLTVLLAALACAVAVAAVNQLKVRPVLGRLIAQARRIDAEGQPMPQSVVSEDEIELLDIEMERMERRIAEARAALEREATAKIAMLSQLRHADRLAMVGRLSAGVAHEFGTPLSVVRGRARLIYDNREVPDDERKSASIIVDQVDRMSRIIRQLLDMSRRRGPPQGPCDLGQLLSRAAQLFEHEASRGGVALAVETPHRPVVALGELQQLEQVALNLVVNALHALAPRGGAVALRCAASVARPPPSTAPLAISASTTSVSSSSSEDPTPSEYVWFEVEDDGPGISEEILPVVFEPFVTTKESGQGTGLGLPLAAGIVQDHGGWITVDSTPGKGARFRVYLRPFPDRAP